MSGSKTPVDFIAGIKASVKEAPDLKERMKGVDYGEPPPDNNGSGRGIRNIKVKVKVPRYARCAN